MENLEFEIRRKLFHFSGIIVPTAYYFIEKQTILSVIIILFSLSLIVDIFRYRNSKFQVLYEKFFKKISRISELEKKDPLGSTWMAIGACITVALFPKYIAIVSLYVLCLSDAMAAIIGKKYGVNKIYGQKTAEGTASFFLSSFIIAYGYKFIDPYSYSFISVIIASSITTAVELFNKEIKLNDNLTIPICFGICLYLF